MNIFCWNQFRVISAGWILGVSESTSSTHLDHWNTIPGFARDRKLNGWILWWIALMPETKRRGRCRSKVGYVMHVDTGSYMPEIQHVDTNNDAIFKGSYIPAFQGPSFWGPKTPFVFGTVYSFSVPKFQHGERFWVSKKSNTLKFYHRQKFNYIEIWYMYLYVSILYTYINSWLKV